MKTTDRDGMEPEALNAQGSDSDAPASHFNRKIILLSLTAIFILLGLVCFFYWLIWARFEEYTDDAYVNGNMVQLMPQVRGTVTTIYADDTALVLKGAPLVQLDRADTEMALLRAEASLAETVRQIRQLYENAQQAQASLVLRRADVIKAQLDLKRRASLVGVLAVSQEELQHAKTTAEAAQAQYDSALHQLRSINALIENTSLYTHPTVQRMKAALKVAYLNWKRTTIVAPVTGYIAKRSVDVGQQVSMSTPMLAVIPLRQIWIDANYKESQLNHLRIGQAVSITADAYPDVEYHGKVVGLSAGTGSAFALLPAQNATGNWIKIVQRLPVRISIDPDELQKYPLRLGLSMRVTTNTHNLSGERLAQRSNDKPVYVTSVYENQLQEANDLINHILQQNSPNIAFRQSVSLDHS